MAVVHVELAVLTRYWWVRIPKTDTDLKYRHRTTSIPTEHGRLIGGGRNFSSKRVVVTFVSFRTSCRGVASVVEATTVNSLKMKMRRSNETNTIKPMFLSPSTKGGAKGWEPRRHAPSPQLEVIHSFFI